MRMIKAVLQRTELQCLLNFMNWSHFILEASSKQQKDSYHLSLQGKNVFSELIEIADKYFFPEKSI